MIKERIKLIQVARDEVNKIRAEQSIVTSIESIRPPAANYVLKIGNEVSA